MIVNVCVKQVMPLSMLPVLYRMETGLLYALVNAQHADCGLPNVYHARATVQVMYLTISIVRVLKHTHMVK